MGLRSSLLNVVLADLPAMSSTLDASSPRWDELLGGKKSPGVWGRFSTGYGTTCIVVLDGWAISAGFPSDMVVTVDTPSGGGTKILQAMYAGATSRGWMREPVRGSLPSIRPGDVYVSNHTTSDGSDGTHVGVVTAVRPADDGQSMEVDTADGGQGTRDHQSAGRRTRTFKLSQGAHPVLIETPGVGESWLERWIAVGGDAADDVPGDAPPAGEDAADGGGGSSGGGGGVVLLGAVGALLVAGGWYYFSNEARPMNAVKERAAAEARIARGVALWREAGSPSATSEFWPAKYRMNATRLSRGATAPMCDATVNLAPTGDVEADYDSRTRFEGLLRRHKIETTGAGMALGDGRSLGADVDVRCRGACDANLLDDLARRAGTSVLCILPNLPQADLLMQ